MQHTQIKRRTNSKEVKAAIQAYIISTIDTSGFTGHDGTLKTSLEIIAAEFKRVALFDNNIRYHKTYQACFIDWLQGLPSCINIDYMNYRILELMESFGLPLPANKEETDGIDLFFALIYREYLSICKQNSVSPY